MRRPLPPPDQRLEEPDFLASILGSIDAMAPTGNGSSASTPADGLCLSSTSLSLSLPCTRTRMNLLILYLELIPQYSIRTLDVILVQK